MNLDRGDLNAQLEVTGYAVTPPLLGVILYDAT